MKQLCVCTCLLIIWRNAFAQPSDTLVRQVQFSATGSINQANGSTAYLLNNDIRFSAVKKHYTIHAGANWIYGETGNNLTNNDFASSADFNLYTRRHKFYYWGLANYTGSYSLKINSQLQAGAGVAYNIIDTTTAWLNLSDGFVYETSSLAVGAGGSEASYQAVRNSFRLAYRFVAAKIFFVDGSNFFQPSLAHSNDYILRLANNAGVKINPWLNLGVSFVFNKFTRTNTQNLLVTYGVTVMRKF